MTNSHALNTHLSYLLSWVVVHCAIHADEFDVISECMYLVCFQVEFLMIGLAFCCGSHEFFHSTLHCNTLFCSSSSSFPMSMSHLFRGKFSCYLCFTSHCLKAPKVGAKSGCWDIETLQCGLSVKTEFCKPYHIASSNKRSKIISLCWSGKRPLKMAIAHYRKFISVIVKKECWDVHL